MITDMQTTDLDTDKLAGEYYSRYCEGDRGAFEELVLLYRESVTLFINRFMRDIYESEELMIDAFAELAVSARKAKFMGGSSLKTYLFSIGKHLALKRRRELGGGNYIPLEDIVELIHSSEGLPETDYLNGESGQQLRSAIDMINPDYGKVLYLLYFEYMSYAEAGEYLGKSEKQITNLVHRAKISLRDLLLSKQQLG
jgi:RNA polymerase sigma-70 factor (ECF subfamily)